MNTFNIIAEWYFCSCINCTPRHTQVYLSILETLDNPFADERSVVTAYEDLSLTDLGLRIYAAPQVLNSLTIRPLGNSRENFKKYFTSLISLVNDKTLAGELFELLQHCLDKKTDKNGLRQLISGCTKRIETAQKNSDEVDINTPYTDLFENLGIILLLTFCHYLTERKNDMLSNFRPDERLSGLLMNAMNGDHGRAAALLASDIAVKVELGVSKGEILKKLLSNKISFAPLYEPDIVYTYLKLFYDSEKGYDNEKLINEYRRLDHFKNILKDFRFSPDNTGFIRILSRVNVNEKDFVQRDSYSIILWQTALQHIILQNAPSVFGKLICEFWTLPDNTGNLVHAVDPFLFKNIGRRDSNALMKIKGYSFEKAKISTVTDVNWLYYSPWLCLERESIDGKPVSTYKNSELTPNMVRLTSSLHYALRMIQYGSDVNESRDLNLQDSLILFVAHAGHVLKDYYTWFEFYTSNDFAKIKTHSNTNNNTEQKVKKLPVSLTGLALMAARQVKVVANGFLPEMPPRLFIDFFRKECLANNQPAVSEPDMVLFKKVFYPYVLISWINDAYLGAVGERSSVDWLTSLPEIYSYFYNVAYKLNFFDKRALAFCTVPLRYLTESDYIHYEFDWETHGAHGETEQWKKPFNIFQLTAKRPPSDWKKNWTELKPNFGGDTSNLRLFLTIATERFASLGLLNGAEFECRNEWVENFRLALTSVQDKIQFNRYARLRLLELVQDDTIWGKCYDLRELASLLIFEFGRAYDLQMLFSYFFINANGIFDDDLILSVDRAKVRKNLIAAIYHELDITTRIEFEKVNAEDFFEKRVNELEQGLIGDMYTLLAYNSLVSENDSLCEELKRLKEESMGVLINTDKYRTVDLEIEKSDDRKLLAQESLSIFRKERIFLQAAVYDEKRKKATVYLNSYNFNNSRKAANLFELSAEQVMSLYTGKVKLTSDNLIAVYAERKQGQYWFNCGFENLLSLRPDYKRFSPELSPGDLVTVKIASESGVWVLYDAFRLEKRNDKRGIYRKLLVESVWDVHDGLLNVKAIDADTQVSSDYSLINKENFLVDHSWVFNEAAADEYEIYVRQEKGRNSEESFMPLYFYLPELLTDMRGKRAPIVLTLIRELVQDGKNGWLFSAKPGKNYLIFQDDIYDITENENNAVDEISKFIHAIGDVIGLLVAFVPVCTKQRAFLKLADMPSQERGDLPENYKDLSLPFDDRNIRWRNLIEDLKEEGSLHAVKLDHTWVLKVNDDIPGFPNVCIEWREQPDENLTEVEIEVDEDFRLNIHARQPATVKASFVEPVSLLSYLPPNSDKDQKIKEFITQYLSWRSGSQVTVADIRGRIPENGAKGNIGAITKEGVIVTLELESLTMYPFRSREIDKELIKNRVFRIERIHWGTHGSCYDSVDLLKIGLAGNFLLEREFEGIVIETPKGKGNSYRVLWLTNGGKVHNIESLSINVRGFNAYPGDKIKIEKIRQGIYRIQIQPRIIFVRALWACEESDSVMPKEVIYLFEKDGFVYMESSDRKGRLQRFSIDSMVSDEKIYQVNKFKSFKPLTYLPANTQRVVLKNNFGHFLFGNNEYRNYKFSARDTLSGIWTTAELWGNNYDIGRSLEFESIVSLSTSENTAENRLGAELKEKLYTEYFENPRLLKGKFNRFNNTVQLTWSDWHNNDNSLYFHTKISGKKEWSRSLPVIGHSLVRGIDYPDEAYFIVEQHQTEGEIYNYANLNHPDGYFPLHLFKNEYYKQQASLSLFFVKKQKADEIQYFYWEWGYGKHLRIPESQIKFKKNSARNHFFLGDEISQLKFSKGYANGIPNNIILNFEYIKIHYSDASFLFFQGERHMIHVLYFEGTEFEFSDVAIDQKRYTRFKLGDIKGSPENLRSETRSFKLHQEPQFTDEQKAMIIELLNSSDKNEVILYGKLNTGKFKNSNGHEIIFEKLTSDLFGEDGVRHGDNVLLKAVEKVGWQNDCRLVLVPLNNKEGDYRNKVEISRYFFSIREDLLEKLDNADVAGNIYLVHILKIGHKFTGSLLDGPARRNSSLLQDVDKNNLYGFVISKDKDQLKLELKPGEIIIFNNWDKSWPALSKSDLKRGDMVKILARGNWTDKQSRSDSIDLTLVARGDSSFITGQTRPGLIFPKNAWHTKEKISLQQFVQQHENLRNEFSVEGFPGFHSASFSNFENFSLLEQLMAFPHPRVGEVFMRGSRLFFKTDQPIIAGAITPKQNSREVFLRTAGNSDRKYNNYALKWEKLTYSDLPVFYLINKLKHYNWRFQIKYTYTWTHNSCLRQELNTEHEPTGTLFFQNFKGILQLRYGAAFLPQFGYPVRALIHSLEEAKKHSLTHKVKPPGYTFAGQSPDKRLWVELCPGRIAELPTALVITKTGNTKKILNYFAWRYLAPGDELGLALSKSSMIEAEEIELSSWRMGPRAALVANGKCKTSAVYDKANNGLLIGSGEYSFTLPCIISDKTEVLVSIDAYNNLKILDSNTSPQKGDVIFIAFDSVDNDIISVQGFDAITALPVGKDDNYTNWLADPLSAILIEKNNDVNSFDTGTLREIVKILNGSIPVTVEDILTDDNNRTLVLFSRRFQVLQNFLDDGEVIIATILGVIGESFMIRCGCHLMLLHWDAVVNNLDASLHQYLTEKLKGQVIWLNKKQDKISVGFSDNEPDDLNVEIVTSIVIAGETNVSGAICRSQETYKLYWVPSDELAWVKIPYDAFHLCYRSGEVFGAYFSKQRKLSIIGSPKAMQEFNSFKLGMEVSAIPVKRLKTLSGLNYYLVKSNLSKNIFECVCRDEFDCQAEGKISVEIIDKSSHGNKTVRALYGRKIYFLDLPPTVSNKAGESKFAKLNKEIMSSAENSDALIDQYFRDTEIIKDLEKGVFYGYQAVCKGSHLGEATLIADRYFDVANQSISLPFYIMALLILFKRSKIADDDEREILLKNASKYCSELGLRALRSYHVQPISDEYENEYDQAALLTAEHDNLQGRFMVVKAKIKKQKAIVDEELFAQIVSFNKLLLHKENRLKKRVLPYTNGLIAAAGEKPDANELIDAEANFTTETIQRLNKLSISIIRMSESSNIFMNEGIEKNLEDILGNMGNLNIVFLDNFFQTLHNEKR